jgi:hypothetical protein
MAVQITTMVPIEPFHLNEFAPGTLQIPSEADVWSSGRKKWKSSFLLWKNHGYTNDGNLVVGYLELEQKEQKGNLVEISFFEKRYYSARTNIKPYHVRWPIPHAERDAMGGFPQNEGYLQ